jgi:hypothetical protein
MKYADSWPLRAKTNGWGKQKTAKKSKRMKTLGKRTNFSEFQSKNKSLRRVNRIGQDLGTH